MVNILVCGTPGTGKSSFARLLAEQTGLRHVEVGHLIKENGLYSHHDDEWDTLILDEENEDKLLDGMEKLIQEGNNVVDYHSCGLFPKRWFDLVLVLRTDNEILYPRLEARGYPPPKITENITCEIMQVILEEARENYAEEIVVELHSNTEEDVRSNIERCCMWLQQFQDRARNQ